MTQAYAQGIVDASHMIGAHIAQTGLCFDLTTHGMHVYLHTRYIKHNIFNSTRPRPPSPRALHPRATPPTFYLVVILHTSCLE